MVFWRSFQMEFSWNYERQMNLAYCYAMIPILKKLYKSKEAMATALKRHLELLQHHPSYRDIDSRDQRGDGRGKCQ